MDIAEILIVVIVLIIGSYLLLVAGSYGKKQKAYYEARAAKSFKKALEHLNENPNLYKVISRNQWSFPKAKWELSNLKLMHNQVVENCIKNVPGSGDVYSESEFCLCVDEQSRTIYYVIGVSEYDFSQLQKNENS